MIGPPTLAFELSDLPGNANVWLPLLGVLLITMSMMMGLRKRRRRPDANMSARDHVDEIRQKQAVRGDLEQLMIEVEQLAKRFGAQLDAKTIQMERLIDETDRKIAELRQLQQVNENAPVAPPAPVADPPAPDPQPPLPDTPSDDPDEVLKQKVGDLADRGCDPVEIARMLDEHVGKIELILALRKS